MHFASGVVRPPYEAHSAYLQITSGCTHDKCLFCTYYKDVPFRVSPMEEVEADIKEMSYYADRIHRVFLQGADAFVLDTDRLLIVAELIHKYLPNVETIAGFARVDNLKNKTVEDLRRLKEAGYGDIVFGIESGDDYILKSMNKGYTKKDILEQMPKLTEAGMTSTIIFLNGIGGKGYGLKHAIETAEVFNQLTPSRVQAPQLTVFPNTPLMEKIKAGTFEESTEEEKFLEMRTFLEHLTIPTLFDATHVSVSTPVYGMIPEKKEELLRQMDETMERYGSKRLQYKRDHIYAI